MSEITAFPKATEYSPDGVMAGREPPAAAASARRSDEPLLNDCLREVLHASAARVSRRELARLSRIDRAIRDSALRDALDERRRMVDLAMLDMATTIPGLGI